MFLAAQNISAISVTFVIIIAVGLLGVIIYTLTKNPTRQNPSSPPQRTLAVGPADRTLAVGPADRTLAVGPADRTLAVGPADPSVRVGPGTMGECALYDVEPKRAALIMAVVANELEIPLSELRFLSIRESKGGL